MLKFFYQFFQGLAGTMVEQEKVSLLTNIPLESPDRGWAEPLYLAFGLGSKPSLEEMRSVVIPFLEGSINRATADFAAGFVFGRRYDFSQENKTGFLTDSELSPSEKFDRLCLMRLRQEGLIEKENSRVSMPSVLDERPLEIPKTEKKPKKDDDGKIKPRQIYPLPIAEMESLLLNYYRSLDEIYKPVFLNLVKTGSIRRSWLMVPSGLGKGLTNKTCYLVNGEDAFRWLRKEFSK